MNYIDRLKIITADEIYFKVLEEECHERAYLDLYRSYTFKIEVQFLDCIIGYSLSQVVNVLGA